MFHNIQKKSQFHNIQEKSSPRRQTSFQIKKKKKKETRESNSIYMYLNDKKLINRVNAFFTRTSCTRLR